MDLTVTHAKEATIADDEPSVSQGDVVPSDWNADHGLVGADELVANVYGLALINMGADDYTLTETEAAQAFKVITNVGDGTKNLIYPDAYSSSVGVIQTLSTGLATNTITVKWESGSTETAIESGISTTLYLEKSTDTVSREDALYATYARTTSTALLTMQTAALTGTAGAGTFEYLTNTPYFTPTASNRGVMVTEHITANASDKSLNNDNTAQSPFNTGTLTVTENTTYLFEAQIYLTTGTTSHTLSFQFDGTATFDDCHYFSTTRSTNTPNHGAVTGGWVAVETVSTVGSSSTATGRGVTLKGSFRITTGGTVIPKIKFSAAPSSTNLCKKGSFFKCNPAGPDTLATVGNWS